MFSHITLYNLVHRAASSLQDRLDVLATLSCLICDAAFDELACGVGWNLAGAVDSATDLNGGGLLSGNVRQSWVCKDGSWVV